MSTYPTLFSPYKSGLLDLRNRFVMGPMTRSRATADHMPTPIMAEYYGQRSSVGLVITEGVPPCPNGAGYARIPGIYTDEQAKAWAPIADAIHKGGAMAFMQLLHTGRVSHPDNMPEGARILAPSAIKAAGQMWTDGGGMQDHPIPEEMTTDDIRAAIKEHVDAARRARQAGFDGVELHGANGYLTEQFLRPSCNQRTDGYGGSPEGYIRFAVEAVEAIGKEIGFERVGIRLSPGSAFNDVPYDPAYDAIYELLAERLSGMGIAYLHLIDGGARLNEGGDETLSARIRERFKGTLILAAGYTADRAEKALSSGYGDLIAFSSAMIANPDLPARIKQGAPLAQPDFSKAYTPGPEGYIDYPSLAESQELATEKTETATA